MVTEKVREEESIKYCATKRKKYARYHESESDNVSKYYIV